MSCKVSIIMLMLVLWPYAASAATTQSGFSEVQAQAFFSSVQGCEDVVVGVSVVETESMNVNVPVPLTQAFVFGVFNNICDIGSSYSFADVVTLGSGEFEQKKLHSATMNIGTNIDGFDVNIDLDWEGAGKTERSKNRVHIKNDAMIVHDSDVITSRVSDISGTFIVNGINYAQGTETGGLSSIRAHTVQIDSKNQ